jgi:hypothetical protein
MVLFTNIKLDFLWNDLDNKKEWIILIYLFTCIKNNFYINVKSHCSYSQAWNTSNGYKNSFLKFIWNNLRGLLLMDIKGKSLRLSNHYMIWNKFSNNDMKNLTKLCCQMSLKSIKYVFMWKTQIKFMSLTC